MKTALWQICVFGSYITFPVKVWSKVCTGGYHCTAPHECCAQGCCLYVPSSGYSPKNPVDNYYVINSPIKYYLWLVVLMVVVALSLAWCCRLRRVWRWGCGSCGSCGGLGGCGGAPPASEADSAGSCYYPPQYSRCGSLCRVAAQPAPPPYNEVTSKPDLYPMVIYLGADKGDGDLMVQYFKNYIVRPTGTLSAASTADSLSSSYLCNTANEANSVIPPPYSCAGSAEWSSAPTTAAQRQALLRSISSVTCHEYVQVTSPRRSLHSTSTQLRCDATGISNSITIDNVNECQHSPVAQTSSGNSQCSTQRSIQAGQSHLSSIPNGHQTNSNATSLTRVYSNELNDTSEASNPSNHQYFNVWEYSTNEELNLKGSFNVQKNYSQENKSPRQSNNKYFGRISSESLDENDQSDYQQYSNYHQSPQRSNMQYTSEPVSNVLYQIPQYFKSNTNDECDGNIKQSNIIDHKQRDFSFHDGACERNTSISNLNSLEENQFCSFFSHSIAEGVQNENISSDYSIYPKNLNNFGSKEEIRRMFSVGNSMTGSEVSSLANLGTPDSPPRATSPTSEFKELLDKIQQLPNEADDSGNEESYFASDVNKAKRYFCKTRKNSLYMPLNLVPSSKTFHLGKVSPTSNICFKRQFSRKGWLSRSAPTTPCGNGIVPNILTVSQRNGASNSGRASRLSKTSQPDGDPLLNEKDDPADDMEH